MNADTKRKCWMVAESCHPADPQKADAWLKDTFQDHYIDRIYHDPDIRRKVIDVYTADVLEREYFADHPWMGPGEK